MKEKIISAVMRAMGRKGGKRRMETMTPEERTAVAKKGGAARAAKATPKVGSGRRQPKLKVHLGKVPRSAQPSDAQLGAPSGPGWKETIEAMNEKIRKGK